MGHTNDSAAEIVRLQNEIASLRKQVAIAERETNKYREWSCESAHVIIESGCVPGVTCQCRCDECKSIAKRMDDAAYMQGVKDRWWIDAKERQP